MEYTPVWDSCSGELDECCEVLQVEAFQVVCSSAHSLLNPNRNQNITKLAWTTFYYQWRSGAYHTRHAEGTRADLWCVCVCTHTGWLWVLWDLWVRWFELRRTGRYRCNRLWRRSAARWQNKDSRPDWLWCDHSVWYVKALRGQEQHALHALHASEEPRDANYRRFVSLMSIQWMLRVTELLGGLQ